MFPKVAGNGKAWRWAGIWKTLARCVSPILLLKLKLTTKAD